MESNILNSKEGKAKKLHWDGSSEFCELQFKNTLTALNGLQKEEAPGKSILNAGISAKLFDFLNAQQINTHFIKKTSKDTIQVKLLKMLPLEVIVRNRAAGSLCKRLGLPEGQKLSRPIVQFHLKDDAKNDPLLTEQEIYAFNICGPEVLTAITNQALLINWLLTALFAQVDICLVDFKLEFGFDKDGNLVLGDELSPDNMRLWQSYQEGEIIQKLDKDRFRENLGSVIEHYQIVFDKVDEALSLNVKADPTPVKVNLFIKPQPGLLDPTGRTLTDAVNRLGFNEVTSIKAGKLLELSLNDFRVSLIEELCERILVSPASEAFSYEIMPALNETN